MRASSHSDSAEADPAGEAAPHLDRPVWMALTTQQRHFAEGDALARRFPPEIGPLGAIADGTPASFASLKRLLSSGDTVWLLGLEPLVPPAGFDLAGTMSVDQMLCRVNPGAPGATRLEPLSEADVPEMTALAALTKPGPFASRTHELGRFLGVRENGRLVAMGGERMHLDGFTEISAVCCHPDHRGKGYGRDLMITLSRRIFARGELPFLHVLSDNRSAIALYRRLGFAWRRTFCLSMLRNAASA